MYPNANELQTNRYFDVFLLTFDFKWIFWVATVLFQTYSCPIPTNNILSGNDWIKSWMTGRVTKKDNCYYNLRSLQEAVHQLQLTYCCHSPKLDGHLLKVLLAKQNKRLSESSTKWWWQHHDIRLLFLRCQCRWTYKCSQISSKCESKLVLQKKSNRICHHTIPTAKNC